MLDLGILLCGAGEGDSNHQFLQLLMVSSLIESSEAVLGKLLVPVNIFVGDSLSSTTVTIFVGESLSSTSLSLLLQSDSILAYICAKDASLIQLPGLLRELTRLDKSCN